MADLATTAREFADAFEQRKRDNGDKFQCLRDGAPEWMRDAVHEAHGDKLPNDWTYRLMARMAAHICEGLEFDADADVSDMIEEASDSLIPAYNGERLSWLASHLDRAGYVDEAVEEYGWPTDAGIFQAIAYGIQHELHEIGNAISGAIMAQADDECEEA